MPLRPDLTRLLRDFERVAQRLDLMRLQRVGGEDASWCPDDVLCQLDQHSASSFLLGTYSEEGIRYGLREYGFLEKLSELGFPDVDIEISTNDPFHQVLRVFDHQDRGEDHLLAEVVMHEGWVTCPSGTSLPGRLLRGTYQALILDWIRLQNPRAWFGPERPRLPGQSRPGLGLGREVFALLVAVGKRLKKDCLLTVPERFHNASFYAKAFHFLSPEREGEFRALRRVLEVYPLAEIAWGIEKGFLMESNSGNLFRWHPSEMLFPISHELCEYLESSAYGDEAEEASIRYRFVPEWIGGQFDSLRYPQPGEGFTDETGR